MQKFCKNLVMYKTHLYIDENIAKFISTHDSQKAFVEIGRHASSTRKIASNIGHFSAENCVTENLFKKPIGRNLCFYKGSCVIDFGSF